MLTYPSSDKYTNVVNHLLSFYTAYKCIMGFVGDIYSDINNQTDSLANTDSDNPEATSSPA